jgi:hypothetical protein
MARIRIRNVREQVATNLIERPKAIVNTGSLGHAVPASVNLEHFNTGSTAMGVTQQVNNLAVSESIQFQNNMGNPSNLQELNISPEALENFQIAVTKGIVAKLNDQHTAVMRETAAIKETTEIIKNNTTILGVSRSQFVNTSLGFVLATALNNGEQTCTLIFGAKFTTIAMLTLFTNDFSGIEDIDK